MLLLDPVTVGDGAFQFLHAADVPGDLCLELKGVGPNIKIGGSLIVMAIIGGAVLTPLMGWINMRISCIAMANSMPLACYTVVAPYAVFGPQVRAEQPAGIQSDAL